MIAREARCDLFFFFNDTAPTEIYTLSLHDALPISCNGQATSPGNSRTYKCMFHSRILPETVPGSIRSEEHTSELQSQSNLVCRLLLEKKITPAFSAVASVVATMDTPASTPSRTLAF